MIRKSVLFILLASQVGTAQSQDLYEFLFKIENPQGPIEGKEDEFGISLAQVGENFVVGAYRDDTGAVNAGAAYVYNRDGQLLTTIHNPTPQADDWFGFNVGSVGDKILIGATNNRPPSGGAAYLYEQDGTLIRTIENPTPRSGDLFGHRVFGINDTILVTARDDSTMAPEAGAAYLFDLEGNLIREIFSPNPVAKGGFGRTPALFGDEAFILGAFLEEVDGETQGGSSYVFDLEGNHLQTFSNPKPLEDTVFGAFNLLLSNDRVLITAYNDSEPGVNAGVAYLFDLEGEVIDIIENPSPARDDWFGATLTGVGDDMFLIGSIFDDTLDFNSGAVYLYDSDGDLLQTFLPPDPAPSGHFGLDLATLDELLLIGSHFDGGRFTGAGAVYVYGPIQPILGDYNDDGSVDQADLDLVLLNWGMDGGVPPVDWISNLPTGLIDQQELDQVLLNWGQMGDATAAVSIPEPPAGYIALAILLIVGSRRWVEDLWGVTCTR